MAVEEWWQLAYAPGMRLQPKSDPITVRESAALPAAGDYDPDPTAVACVDWSMMELRITYTRGAAAGSAKFKILVSDEQDGDYYERTIDDGTINADIATASSYSNLWTSEKQLPVPPSGDPARWTFLVDVSTARFVKVAFAEVGDPGNPGTVACDAVLGGEQQ